MKPILQWWKQESNQENEGRVKGLNYRRFCTFEGENVYIENKERENEEDKGSEEECSQKRYESSRLRRLFIWRKKIYTYHKDYAII